MNKNQTLDQLVASWHEKKIISFQQDFLSWYDQEKRLLPWRVNQEPYSVWVSEIMLQQTQVSTVIPYYERFMEWFPTVAALAEAPEDRLLKAWEGLGYYSRVRNMQFAAKQVMTDYGGVFPDNAQELKKLKGIGPYTAGAIASISFNEPAPAVDGNVMRVYSRLFGIREDIAKPATLKHFDFVVRHVISHERPGDMNQATMDLGSSICTPTKPDCENCPLKTYCLAYKEGTQESYPVKLKKIKTKQVYYVALAMENQEGAWAFNQRPSEGLLANLWTFPMLEISEARYQQFKRNWEEHISPEESSQLSLALVAEDAGLFQDFLKATDNEQIIWQKQPVGEITHIFSHLKWHVLVAYGVQKGRVAKTTSLTWLSKADFAEYPVPKPQEKMIKLLKQTGHLQ